VLIEFEKGVRVHGTKVLSLRYRSSIWVNPEFCGSPGGALSGATTKFRMAHDSERCS
jgi:hypothetical protein